MISADTKDTSVILISGLNFLSNKKIKECTLSKSVILPGDTVLTRYLGIDYKIYATGEKRKESENWYSIWNYKLYLTTTKNGNVYNELLVSQPNSGDAMISILFAGDIDGDGFLDLLINTSSHYNTYAPTLYLSKPAKKENLLKVVAQHLSVGC